MRNTQPPPRSYADLQTLQSIAPYAIATHGFLVPNQIAGTRPEPISPTLLARRNPTLRVRLQRAVESMLRLTTPLARAIAGMRPAGGQ